MQQDLGLIIAIIGSTLAIVGTIIAMFFWVRGEANADRISLQADRNTDMRNYQEIARQDRNEMLNIIKAIEYEIKDFHYRLLKIEEKK